MIKIADTDFSNVEEIKNDLDFYKTVLSAHKALFSAKNGFDLYFINEIDADLSNFSEKDFYSNKLDRIIDSFKEMEKIFDAKKSIEKMLYQKEEILKALNQESISLTEIDLIYDYLNSMELDRYFHKANSRMNQFIEDSKKNLPKQRMPIHITKHYRVSNKKVELVSSSKRTEKRTSTGNNIYLSNSSKNIRVIYAGHKPFPLAGSGSKEIWQKTKGKWKRIISSRTWIS